MHLLDQFKEKAKLQKKRIVLPESLEERTLKAADILIGEEIAEIILIGESNEILKRASKFELTNISNAVIVDPNNNPNIEKYAGLMVELRKNKGLTNDQALSLLKEPLYLAAVMVKAGDADGEVAGAMNSTGDVLRPAFQYVKTKPGISVVSGAFLMILQNKEFGENGLMVFADCAVHPNPTAQELAEIAVSTGQTTKNLVGFEPKIAMLSFSTKGSAKHEMVDKVQQATQIAQQMAPDMQIEGELQSDAAIVESIGQLKAPGSKIAGNANVLVFPSLETGNICYKLVQRLANAEAVGPVLQGMAAPINDLSRGCSVSDIVNLTAITAVQAQSE